MQLCRMDRGGTFVVSIHLELKYVEKSKIYTDFYSYKKEKVSFECLKSEKNGLNNRKSEKH